MRVVDVVVVVVVVTTGKQSQLPGLAWAWSLAILTVQPMFISVQISIKVIEHI